MYFCHFLFLLYQTGRSDVGRVLRGLLRRKNMPTADSSAVSSFSVSTVLLILQDLAAEELEEAFDSIDEVVKEGGTSTVKIDEQL